MGCHTWFKVKRSNDQILSIAQQALNINAKYMDANSIEFWQSQIDTNCTDQLFEFIEDYTDYYVYEIDGMQCIFEHIDDYAIRIYNEKFSTNVRKYDSFWSNNRSMFEDYSDEPRIGGYPERIIRSYDDMLDFMKTGYIDSRDQHYMFRYDESRYPKFMAGIKQFFINHPDGIITFG